MVIYQSSSSLLMSGSKLWEEWNFVSWNKYHFIDYFIRWLDTFTKWTKIIFNDPDDWEEFIWEIEWIIILEDNSIEASIKDIAYWRVSIDILEIY